MKKISALLVAATLFVTASARAEPSAAELCGKDLEVLPAFLLENDTGAKFHLEHLGQKHFDEAMTAAKKAAAEVTDAAGCDQVLRQYLKAWRKGHLNLRTLNPAPASAATETKAPTPPVTKVPQIRELSRQTMLITLPSFASQNREPLVALLKKHHAALAAHRNWIVDVRGNGGGSDSSYDPILPWLLSDETATAGAAWLSTPTNIRGQEEVCAAWAPGDAVCEKEAKIGAARMRSVKPGEYVNQEDFGAIAYERPEKPEPRRPARVAVLIDGHCGSSCEEFVLAVRQSFAVKLIGRPTFGSLDYSNLRLFTLPSGQRSLMYAISRSSRLPDYPVDVSGIQPDIYLPLPAGDSAAENETERVKRWLEGGSLDPAKTALVKPVPVKK